MIKMSKNFESFFRGMEGVGKEEEGCGWVL